MALRARREYLQQLPPQPRIARHGSEGSERPGADLSTIETLVQELVAARPGARRLRHRHARVARQAQPGHAAAALSRVAGGAPAGAAAIGAVRRDIALSWLPQRPPHAERCGLAASARRAIAAIGNINNEDAATLVAAAAERSRSADPRHRRRRAGGSREPADVDAAEAALRRSRQRRARPRREASAAMSRRRFVTSRIRDSGRLLIPLLYDEAPEVAHEAMDSVQAAGTADFIFVPTLVALLRNRQLKARARAGARQLRRAGRRRARAFPARSRGRHLGAAAHPDGAGADPVAEVGRRAGRGARRAGRLPPIQGHRRARSAAPHRRAALVPDARRSRRYTLREGAHYLQLSVASQQPVCGEDAARRARPAVEDARTEDGADTRPHLPPARADLSVARHRRRAMDAGARRRDGAAPAPRNISTTS